MTSSARGCALATLAGVALLLSACTASPDDTPTIKVTVTASDEPTASPSPSPSQEEEPTAEAPFQAVMSIAELSIDGELITLAGFATGLAEDDGDCLFTLTGPDGAVVERQTTGIANVSDSSCGSTEVPITEVSRGTWVATLTYTSTEGASVTSLPLALEVP